MLDTVVGFGQVIIADMILGYPSHFLIITSLFLIAGICSFYKTSHKNELFIFAGFLSRFLAAIIDIIIILIISFIFAFLYTLYSKSSAINGATVGVLSQFIISWLYYTFCESSKLKATFGKKVLGICVVDLNGNEIGFIRANGRFWGKLLSMSIYFIGFYMIAVTKNKQSLHDKMARCLVVKANSPILLSASSLTNSVEK
jgi:uncharacterized RDD family membrane protein YckC